MCLVVMAEPIPEVVEAVVLITIQITMAVLVDLVS
jgi:hypothetical protein